MSSYNKRLLKYVEGKADVTADYIIHMAKNSKEEARMIKAAIEEAWLEGYRFATGSETGVQLYSEPDE